MPAYKFIVQKIVCSEQQLTVWCEKPLQEDEPIPTELEDLIIDKACERQEWVQAEDWAGEPFTQYTLHPLGEVEDVDDVNEVKIVWTDEDATASATEDK